MRAFPVRRWLRRAKKAPEILRCGRETPAVASLLRHCLQLGNPRFPFELPLRDGGTIRLSSPAEAAVFWQVFVSESYALPTDCDTILDCGANVGLFSIWAARKRPSSRIFAIEPCRDTFAALKANIDRNQLHGRVTCAQIGLAAANGPREIGLAGGSPNRKLLPASGAGLDDTAPHDTVTCVTLADCLRQFDLDALDLLKMDIEGSEWEVLLSTEPDVLRRIRFIQLEYHEVNASFNYSPALLINHLAAAGHGLTYRIEDEWGTGIAHFEQRANAKRLASPSYSAARTMAPPAMSSR